MKIALLFAMIILLAAAAQAAELTFRDSETGARIRGIITVNIDGKDITKTLDSNGTISLNITEGKQIELTADSTKTLGKDYYNAIDYSGEKEILLFPAASLRGIVKDSLDNIVGFAELKFACKPLPKINHPLQADNFGTFSTITPTGKCKVYASYENALGFEEITLEQGELKDIEIKLDKTIVTIKEKKSYAGYEIALLIAAIIILIIYFAVRRKKARHTAKETRKEIKQAHKKETALEKEEGKEAKQEKKQEQKASKRSEDIIKTLNQKEKEVVNYLQLNKGEINQASIRHNTGIPRTSLSRIMISLENKNIIKIRKEGKAVKISLTDWFLEKG